uniref:Uncharacterized protein n=1 Tax=Pyxicephalus adspersus TaxID=30357 RepID=A0AAV3A1P4_PYXAD|nr:TPA: hypothetical protein GDO54_002931 [Pyxicephalus adspersus]DBA17498.1 TPA: hypothetical protein GDO54_002931 [Pyxicephalus adspersus]
MTPAGGFPSGGLFKTVTALSVHLLVTTVQQACKISLGRAACRLLTHYTEKHSELQPHQS